MAITVGTDTYISLADADTYMSSNYVSTSTEFTTWDALSDGDKEIYLKNATKRIDRQLLRGIKAVETQTLEFPRALRSNNFRWSYYSISVTHYNGWVIEQEVSQLVKDAQVEEAMQLAVEGQSTSDRRQLQQQGIKRFKLGDLEEEYGSGVASSVNGTKLISGTARELLNYYTSGGMRIC